MNLICKDEYFCSDKSSAVRGSAVTAGESFDKSDKGLQGRLGQNKYESVQELRSTSGYLKSFKILG